MTYNQYKDRIHVYKQHGLNQFISLFRAHKDRKIPVADLKWGEEMEYIIYVKNSKNCEIKLSDQGPKLIQKFNESGMPKEKGVWLMPEFGSWMIEAVPSKPYDSLVDLKELLSCEEKLHARRETLDRFCSENGVQIVSMSNAPTLGTPNHIHFEDETLRTLVQQNQVSLEAINPACRSQFVVDKSTNPHPRFAGLMQSIRERRGEKVEIRVPIFKDKHTNLTSPTADEPYPGEIYMDAMHFGMGQCCLQITYECSTINHARYLHDMLLPFTGIMAALSASGPIFKG